MIDHTRRVQVADELLRRFASALRAAQLYSPSHPLVARNVALFGETLGIAFGQQRSITLGVVGSEFVVGDVPLPRASSMMSDLLQRLQRAGIERIAIEREVATEELSGLVQALASSSDQNGEESVLPTFPHIQVGRIQVQQRVEPTAADTATVRRLYADASNIASQLWQAAAKEGKVDPGQSKQLVDSLAQAVAHNRTALIALDRAQELRQLHVHAHGERLDSDDGAGAVARAGRRGAPGVRRRGADARHRQSAHAD